jgi:hypothetical protein
MISAVHKIRLALTLPPLLAALTGCSTFNRDWRAARQPPAGAGDIAGRWQGNWESEVNGHRGQLRCLLNRKDGNLYQARYRATFWKILRYGYTVELKATPRPDGAFAVAGQENLGALVGGVFHYEGTLTPTEFFATYHSRRDRGVFQMRRPEPEPP